MRKTVVITGSSKGIGACCADLFACNGYNVVINYLHSKRSAMELSTQIKKRGGNVLVVCADVSIRSDVRKMMEMVYEHYGDVDVLVNNAAISQWGVFNDTTEDEWDRMFDVNVKGMYNCCQEVLTSMIRNKRGKIINVSSVLGMVGCSCEVAYSASKGAVISFTKALAKELGPSKIQVNCVAPGVIDTDMNSNLSHDDLCALKEATPLGTLGKPSDVAELILFLASQKADFITGQVISPNGGFVI